MCVSGRVQTWKEWAFHSMRAGMVVAQSGLSVAVRAGGVVAHMLARASTLAVRVSQDATRLVMFITTLYYILAAKVRSDSSALTLKNIPTSGTRFRFVGSSSRS